MTSTRDKQGVCGFGNLITPPRTIAIDRYRITYIHFDSATKSYPARQVPVASFFGLPPKVSRQKTSAPKYLRRVTKRVRKRLPTAEDFMRHDPQKALEQPHRPSSFGVQAGEGKGRQNKLTSQRECGVALHARTTARPPMIINRHRNPQDCIGE